MQDGTSATIDEAESADAPLPVRLLIAVAACGSVIPLLAWVYDLGKFSTWGLTVGLPLVVALVVIAAVLERTGRFPGTRAAITAGALGGLLGTLGYDLFRVPFVAILGMQLLAPIDSYGVLLADASVSSGATGWLGWSYHTINGLGFGVAYAVVMRGRHWGFGILWALVLETAVVLSPFATDYALRTDAGFKWLPIGLAYLAHIPYGYAVGRFAQHAGERHERARAITRRPVTVALALVGAGFALWLTPFLGEDTSAVGNELAMGPSAVVGADGAWHPAWLRVPPGGCVTIGIDPASGLQQVNVAQPGTGLGELPTLQHHTPLDICPPRPGITRWQVDEQPFSGGWIIVDDQLD